MICNTELSQPEDVCVSSDRNTVAVADTGESVMDGGQIEQKCHFRQPLRKQPGPPVHSQRTEAGRHRHERKGKRTFRRPSRCGNDSNQRASRRGLWKQQNSGIIYFHPISWLDSSAKPPNLDCRHSPSLEGTRSLTPDSSRSRLWQSIRTRTPCWRSIQSLIPCNS